MKAFTFCQFCRKMADHSNSTSFNFINPSQTSAVGESHTKDLRELKSEFQNCTHKNLPTDKITEESYLLRLCHPELHSAFVSFYSVIKVGFLDVSGSVFHLINSISGCKWMCFCLINKAVQSSEENKGALTINEHELPQDWSFTSNKLSSLICYTGNLFLDTLHSLSP